MKLILLFAFSALAIAAQPTVTTVNKSQISGCGPNTILAFPPQLPGVPATGNAVCVAMPVGLQVVTLNGVTSFVLTANTGSTGPNFADAEVPAGTVNGTTAAFTLAHSPSPASSLILQRNGVGLKQGLDYAVSGSNITFVAGAMPQAGDVLQCWYRY